MTTFRTITASFTFTVEILEEPVCLPDFFYLQSNLGTTYYYLTSEATTSNPYTFLQSPDCGHEVTVTINGLPSFVDHRPETRDFLVNQLFDVSYLNFYRIDIFASITYFADDSRTT